MSPGSVFLRGRIARIWRGECVLVDLLRRSRWLLLEEALGGRFSLQLGTFLLTDLSGQGLRGQGLGSGLFGSKKQ